MLQGFGLTLTLTLQITCGDVQPRDVVVGDFVEVLAQTADGVAVGHDQDALSALDCRGDFVLPLHEEAVLCQLPISNRHGRKAAREGKNERVFKTKIVSIIASELLVD